MTPDKKRAILEATARACDVELDRDEQFWDMSQDPAVLRLWNPIDNSADTSALEAIVNKAGEVMRERCAKEGWMAANGDCEDRVASAIRDLPAVTLEDLK